MNIQEIERMEGLIKKARRIVETIEILKDRIHKVTGVLFENVVIHVYRRAFDISEWNSKQRLNDYNAEVEAYMINAFIDITKAEIERLEKELADLWIWD
ncbi:hypothetical protein [Brevibacillus laterosporus]|uniref:Uncharacterized protein n=1 Tax=Brevibacillus laterosporus TaxID=1465 RepID=A0AAP3DD69_BRELA|nr:hypothetical protein [Brevibacillus laterosporus]MCR8978726.1 hypothetical protein [Brevibacillus laterosporus]MCZ0805882.1 hypothetical protein [Brevibacillus laterosporus]MCZ0824352.1 hypothetical protein [Brevibacillus laterosporus]MCZ0848256.1 hypothetical protein [Brevibacillus laterosporus]